MKMQPVSWNGNVFSPNYNVQIIYPAPLRVSVSANFLERGGSYPIYTGKTFSGGGYMSIQIFYQDTLPENVHIREQEIKHWFNTLDEDTYKLLAQDTSDTDREWYVMATPVSVVQENNSAVILLALETPYWATNDLSTSTWNITGSGQTHEVTSIGEIAFPVLKIKPTSSRVGGYAYRRFTQVLNYYASQLTNHPINLGPLNTADLVTAGKALSSGNDFRVFVDGYEVPRWFGTGTSAFNQTATKIWIALDMIETPQFVIDDLDGDILSGDTVTEIQFAKTPSCLTKLQKLPTTGAVRYLGTVLGVQQYEYFTYTGVDLINYKLTGVTRAAKDSTACDWTAATFMNAYFIEHDIYIVYGKPSATAPVYDESHKPLIDMTSSTNSSWTYTEFFDEGNMRSGAYWTKEVFSSTLGTSAPYTGEHGVNENPATTAGMKLATAKVGGVEASETASVAWTLFHPLGSNMSGTATGERYRATSNWPSDYKQLLSKNGDIWVDGGLSLIFADPTYIGAWSSFTASAGGVSDTKYLRLVFAGTLDAIAGNNAMLEIDSFVLTGIWPVVPTIRDEVSQSYDMQAKITNLTTGEAMYITWFFENDATLTVDCSARTSTYEDGTNALAAVTLDSDRPNWMTFLYGVNELQYDEVGAVGLTITVEWTNLESA